MSFRPPMLPPVHRAGRAFILIGLVAALFAWALSLETLGLLLLALSLFMLYFFRNPARTTPVLDGILVSGADGIVTAIAEVPPPEELEMGGEPLARISVFLSVFDVHVIRTPASGVVRRLAYVPGRFLNAALDKASEDNERQLVRIDMADGRSVAVALIAGLVARRIVCDLGEDQSVEAGARIGIIRFGSRVDVYCPRGMRPMVLEGQRVVGGETVIATDAPVSGPREGRRT